MLVWSKKTAAPSKQGAYFPFSSFMYHPGGFVSAGNAGFEIVPRNAFFFAHRFPFSQIGDHISGEEMLAKVSVDYRKVNI
jgi:hypothetical protein